MKPNEDYLKNGRPEWDSYSETPARCIARPRINGQVKYDRLPIRHRQLRYECENFHRWIAHLIDSNAARSQKAATEGKTYHNFFDSDKVALLIVGRDNDGYFTDRLGTEENLALLRELAAIDPEQVPQESE